MIAENHIREREREKMRMYMYVEEKPNFGAISWLHSC